MEFDVIQGALASIGAGAVTAFGWLTSRLWALWRREVDSMKQDITNTSAAVSTMGDRLIEHMVADEEIQRTISSDLSEIKGYIKGAGGTDIGG